MLALNSKREFVIIQDKRKDGEIWVSLKQQEVRSAVAVARLAMQPLRCRGVCCRKCADHDAAIAEVFLTDCVPFSLRSTRWRGTG